MLTACRQFSEWFSAENHSCIKPGSMFAQANQKFIWVVFRGKPSRSNVSSLLFLLFYTLLSKCLTDCQLTACWQFSEWFFKENHSCVKLESAFVQTNQKFIQVSFHRKSLRSNVRDTIQSCLHQPQSLESQPRTKEEQRNSQHQDSPLNAGQFPKHLYQPLLHKPCWCSDSHSESNSILASVDQDESFGSAGWPAIHNNWQYDRRHKYQTRGLHRKADRRNIYAASLVQGVYKKNETGWSDEEWKDQGRHTVFRKVGLVARNLGDRTGQKISERPGDWVSDNNTDEWWEDKEANSWGGE